MPEPTFLTIEDVAAIHLDQIDLYGGCAGVRDHGGLESALAQPQATCSGQFLHADLCSMAAAYLSHLVQNHPFIDGNKRAGTVAALVFLDINDIQVNAEQDTWSTSCWRLPRASSPRMRSRPSPGNTPAEGEAAPMAHW